MRNPFGRLIRHLQREHPEKSVTVSVLAGLGAGVGTLLTGGLGLPLLAVPAIGAGAGVMGGLLDNADSLEKHRGTALEINGLILVGASKDLTSIKRAQDWINRKTVKHQHLAAVPDKLQQKIAAHVEDMQEVLQRIRIFNQNEEALTWGDFSFTRTYYNDRGRRTQEMISAATGLPRPPFAPKDDAPPPVPPAGDAAAGFNRLAGKEKKPKPPGDEPPTPTVILNPKN